MQEMMLSGGSGMVFPWSGPGNKKLLHGTRDLGYFGQVAAADLFTDASLATLTGLTAADGRWANGEWNRTLGRMGCNSFTLCTRSRLGNKAPVTTSTSAACSIALTQHFRTLSSAMISFFNTASDVPTQLGWTSDGYYWRPVLELIL